MIVPSMRRAFSMMLSAPLVVYTAVSNFFVVRCISDSPGFGHCPSLRPTTTAR